MKNEHLRLQVINLILQTSTDYLQSKQNSQKIDDLLGLNCIEVENSIQKNSNIKHFSELGIEKQLWMGLDIQGLQTPYIEIIGMLKLIEPIPGQHWVDLGAGYGRMGFIIGLLFPELKFTGYEYVQERVDEGNRILKLWQITNAELICSDLASTEFTLPQAEVFFIYDFGSRKDVEKCLESLKMVSKNKKIKVIARGRGVRNWIFHSHPWLYSVNEVQHFENWSLFNT